MTLLLDWVEGFDDYPDLGGDVGMAGTWSVGGANVSLAPGRFGNRCFQQGSHVTPTQRPITSTTKLAMGFAFKVDNINSAFDVTGTQFFWLSSSNNQQQFVIGSDDEGFVRVGPNLAAPLLKSIRRLVNGTWHFIEFELELSDTVGRFKLWIDGQLQGEVTGVDTKMSADPDIGRVFLTGGGNNAFPNGFYYDDMYARIDSATAIGESRAQLQTLTADDAVQWARLGGASNTSQIGEAQCDRDVTYNSSNNVGDQDTFSLENFAGNPTQIFAVVLSIAAKKDDAGTRTVAPLVKINGNIHQQTDLYQTTQYLWGRNILPVNPETGQPWTKADFQGTLKVGYKLTA